jgi:hypothetical protein
MDIHVRLLSLAFQIRYLSGSVFRLVLAGIVVRRPHFPVHT